MENRFVVTPFVLDKREDAFREVAGTDWVMNAPPLPEGTVQARLSALHEPLAQFVAETVRAGKRPVSLAGDALFVPAGVMHRFENYSDDFATWVVFWGKQGGEGEIEG